MEPDSNLLLILLFGAAVALVIAAIRTRHLAVKIIGGLLTILLSTAGGITVVNDYYGYYQSWSQLSSDLSDSYTGFATTTVARHVGRIAAGRVESIELPGAKSGLDRAGLIYLPPQYFEPAYAHTDFPVVELLHGTPGTPANWVVQLHLATTLDRLIALHQMGPVIAVMPTMSVGTHFEECVNGPEAADDTYITQDVRHDVLARFRAAPSPAEWGVAGYSSGGYCAANLALRHPSEFGAAGIIDGYFRPTDGPAAAALGDNPALERVNDPLVAAARLEPGAHPLPSFWLSAGTGDAADYQAALAFGRALHGIERITLNREPGASHNFYAWIPAIPDMLTWLWTQLAPPALRVDFPISGKVRSAEITGGESPVVPRAARPSSSASRVRHERTPRRTGGSDNK